MTSVVIRRLVPADAAAFRAIRLEALRTAPDAFGSSYDAEKDRPESQFAANLESSHVVGAFVGADLVGNAGFYVSGGPKEAHRGNIWGVFVRPDHRGTGIARALIEAILAIAREQVLQVHLSVVTTNASALHLYERLGFVTYGTEPRALRIGDRFVDEHLMVKRLDA